MRVVVTGGSGRLGRYVVRELLAHEYTVCPVDVIGPPESSYPTEIVDLADFAATLDAFENADAVIHLARIRFPYTENGFNVETQSWEFRDIAGDAGRFNRNVAMTNNVLAAAQASGIRKLVSGSSLAVYGFYYASTSIQPDYLPVDEDHPVRPQDPYGLTKLVGERLCEALARRSGAAIASLRFAGVYTEAHRPMLRERAKTPLIRGTGAFWSYVDARDAARACRLALEAEICGHQTFNICARSTFMSTPTRELIARYLPDITELRRDLDGTAAGYGVLKANTQLGFASRHSLMED